MTYYAVVIDSIEGLGTNYRGEANSIAAALKNVQKEVEDEYGRGLVNYTYSTYKYDPDMDRWVYLQTLGR